MPRCLLLLCLLALAGCESSFGNGLLSNRQMLFGASDKELVGSFRTTDYAVGETYSTKRDLLAKKLPGPGWKVQYFLTGNNSAETIVPERSFFSWGSPEQASLPIGTRLKIAEILPADKANGQSAPQVVAEILDGPLKGKRVALSTISREHRFRDPEFLTPADTVAVAANSLPVRK